MSPLRFAVCSIVVLVAACGGGSSLARAGGPQSAASVSPKGSDFPGLKRCPETGSVDTFLKAEGAAGGRLYENDRANWSRLEAAGADDGYISFYAQNAADCPSADREPSADFLSALVVRFKDSASAMSDYKTSASNYSLADSDVLGIRSAGGAAVQGNETGLGSNSVTVSVVFGLIALNRCFWQHNEFEVLVDAAFISASDVKSTCQKIDGRIT